MVRQLVSFSELEGQRHEIGRYCLPGLRGPCFTSPVSKLMYLMLYPAHGSHKINSGDNTTIQRTKAE